MKPIGFLKKKSKAWCLQALESSGEIMTGYTGYNNSLGGGYEEVKAKIEEAKAKLAAKLATGAVKPAEMDQPTTICSQHSKNSTPEDIKAWDDWRQNRTDLYEWTRIENAANLIAFEHTPVFQEDLRFVGYSKGRSSFTLDFVTKSGEYISFGPKTTGELVEAIINDSSACVDLIGWSVEINKFNIALDKFDKTVIPYVGKGINVRFCFIKQGENIYAQVTKEELMK